MSKTGNGVGAAASASGGSSGGGGGGDASAGDARTRLIAEIDKNKKIERDLLAASRRVTSLTNENESFASDLQLLRTQKERAMELARVLQAENKLLQAENRRQREETAKIMDDFGSKIQQFADQHKETILDRDHFQKRITLLEHENQTLEIQLKQRGLEKELAVKEKELQEQMAVEVRKIAEQAIKDRDEIKQHNDATEARLTQYSRTMDDALSKFQKYQEEMKKGMTDAAAENASLLKRMEKEKLAPALRRAEKAEKDYASLASNISDALKLIEREKAAREAMTSLARKLQMERKGFLAALAQWDAAYSAVAGALEASRLGGEEGDVLGLGMGGAPSSSSSLLFGLRGGGIPSLFSSSSSSSSSLSFLSNSVLSKRRLPSSVGNTSVDAATATATAAASDAAESSSSTTTSSAVIEKKADAAHADEAADESSVPSSSSSFSSSKLVSTVSTATGTAQSAKSIQVDALFGPLPASQVDFIYSALKEASIAAKAKIASDGGGDSEISLFAAKGKVALDGGADGLSAASVGGEQGAASASSATDKTLSHVSEAKAEANDAPSLEAAVSPPEFSSASTNVSTAPS